MLSLLVLLRCLSFDDDDDDNSKFRKRELRHLRKAKILEKKEKKNELHIIMFLCVYAADNYMWKFSWITLDNSFLLVFPVVSIEVQQYKMEDPL